MSDKFKLFLDIETDNIDLLTRSFEIVRDYIISENNTSKLNLALKQAYPLMQSLLESDNFELDYIDTTPFRVFMSKIKVLSSFSEAQKFISLIEGDKTNIYLLKEELDDNFKKSSHESLLTVAHAYFDFYSVIKSSLSKGEEHWGEIKNSWNNNYEYFDTDKITHTQLQSFLGSTDQLHYEFYTDYFKFVKICQEKIAESLWNHFLNYPEKSEEFSRFAPCFFQFINWLEKSDITTRNFVGLLEQNHFDNLSYASKIQGFDFFLEKLFLLTPEIDDNFDPFSQTGSNQYNYINLDSIKNLNAKGINADVLFKNNTLQLSDHLRGYLYHHIEKLEKSDKKHSQTEFLELDKLLTIYEKQKLESVLIPKNTKSKKLKI